MVAAVKKKPKRCHLPPMRCPARWICLKCGVKCCEHRCGFKRVEHREFVAVCGSCQRTATSLTRVGVPTPRTLLKKNDGRPSYALLAVWPPAEGEREPTIMLLEGVLHPEDLKRLVNAPRQLDGARKWLEASTEVQEAKEKKNEVNRRWEEGVEHDPRSVALAKALADIDYKQGGDYFDFKFGGDGDSGEELCFLLDIFFAQGGFVP